MCTPRRSRPPPSRCSSQPQRARSNQRRQPRPPAAQPAATAAAAVTQLQRPMRVRHRTAAAAARRANARGSCAGWPLPCRARRRAQRICPGNGSPTRKPRTRSKQMAQLRSVPALVAFGVPWRLRCACSRRAGVPHRAGAATARTAGAPSEAQKRQLPSACAAAPPAPQCSRRRAHSQPAGALRRRNARQLQAPERPRPHARRPRERAQARTASGRPFSRRDANRARAAQAARGASGEPAFPPQEALRARSHHYDPLAGCGVRRTRCPGAQRRTRVPACCQPAGLTADTARSGAAVNKGPAEPPASFQPARHGATSLAQKPRDSAAWAGGGIMHHSWHRERRSKDAGQRATARDAGGCAHMSQPSAPLSFAVHQND